MSHSKITIHRSANVAELLTKLPNDIARNITANLEQSKENKLFVSVISRSPRLQFKFVESFFHQSHITLSPSASPTDFSTLSDDTVACFYTLDEHQLLEDNNTDITFWLIGLDDDIDEAYGERMREIKTPVIPIIIYNTEEYAELVDESSDFELGSIKIKTDEIKTRLVQSPDVYPICLSNPASLATVGDRVIALLSGGRKVHGGLTLGYHCLSDEAKRLAEGVYINVFINEIRPYYDTLSEEKKKELKALFELHLNEYVKAPGGEEDVMSTIISAASSAAATAKTGIDSLIKTIKSKF